MGTLADRHRLSELGAGPRLGLPMRGGVRPRRIAIAQPHQYAQSVGVKRKDRPLPSKQLDALHAWSANAWIRRPRRASDGQLGASTQSANPFRPPYANDQVEEHGLGRGQDAFGSDADDASKPSHRLPPDLVVDQVTNVLGDDQFPAVGGRHRLGGPAHLLQPVQHRGQPAHPPTVPAGRPTQAAVRSPDPSIGICRKGTQPRSGHPA
jgi:hypothetical protein